MHTFLVSLGSPKPLGCVVHILKEISIKESSFDIHFLDFIIMVCSDSTWDPNGFTYCNWWKGFILVYTMNFFEAFSNQPRFVGINLSVNVSFLFENPLSSYRINSFRCFNQLPNLIWLYGIHFRFHGFMPLLRFRTSIGLFVIHRLILVHKQYVTLSNMRNPYVSSSWRILLDLRGSCVIGVGLFVTTVCVSCSYSSIGISLLFLHSISSDNNIALIRIVKLVSSSCFRISDKETFVRSLFKLSRYLSFYISLTTPTL